MATRRRKKRKSPAKRTTRVYVSNPRKKARKRRRYRRNPDSSIVTLLSALAGFVAGNKVIGMIPGSATVKNAGIAAVGSYGSVSKFGKKNPIIQGLSIGITGVATKNLIVSKIPALAGKTELPPDEQAMLVNYANNKLINPDDFINDPAEAEAVLGEALDFNGIETETDMGEALEFTGMGEALSFSGTSPEDFNQTLI